MAWNEQDLTNLEKSMAQGVLEVMYGDKRVIYRSLDEMKILREDMRRELGIGQRPLRKYPTFSKGLK